MVDLHDAGATMKYLIRDRDSRYTAAFDAVLHSEGIAIVKTGIQVPRMNAIMERWVRTCRTELLNRTLIMDRSHLLHALREYETFYNEHRPHRALRSAAPLRPLPQPIIEPRRLDRLDIAHALISCVDDVSNTGPRATLEAPSTRRAAASEPSPSPVWSASDMGPGQVIIWWLRSAALIGILLQTSGSTGCLRVSRWYLRRTKVPPTECGGRVPGSRQRTGCAGREPRRVRRCGDAVVSEHHRMGQAPGRLRLATWCAAGVVRV
jgi:hypothetical protein